MWASRPFFFLSVSPYVHSASPQLCPELTSHVWKCPDVIVGFSFCAKNENPPKSHTMERGAVSVLADRTLLISVLMSQCPPEHLECDGKCFFFQRDKHIFVGLLCIKNVKRVGTDPKTRGGLKKEPGTFVTSPSRPLLLLSADGGVQHL